MSSTFGEFTASLLRIDLSTGGTSVETIAESELEKFIGGTGLGASILYREVPSGVEWSDPENRLILGSGPLGGTQIQGSGTFSVITKGCLTNGATSTQANGHFGAFLRRSGYELVVVQGVASEWSYLLITDEGVEVRDASKTAGADTWATEDLIKGEINRKASEISVFGIGPAGENLVKFSAILGDRGHAAAHNGAGTVVGSKKLKAVAVVRGKRKVRIKDPNTIARLIPEMREYAARQYPWVYEWGTSMLYSDAALGGWPLVRNLQTSIFPEHEKYLGEYYRPLLEMKRTPCWACPAHHCHIVKVLHSPYAGYEAEEPEYEAWAAFTSLIDERDHGAAIMLADTADRLGLDINEAGWVLGLP